jgi:hypothetical protein
MKVWKENCNETKWKLWRIHNENVNAATLQFFLQCHCMNIPISGQILQSHGNYTETSENFQACNGQLELFRTWHNINISFLSGESEGVETEAAEDRTAKLHYVTNEYAPSNQFNADEVELLNRHMPRKSLIQKREKCKAMKLSMERLSVFWYCSATNEKLKPLVIINAAYPLEFQEQETDDKYLPFDWCSNKKWWMIQTIFEEWLEDLNCMAKKQNWKILLLVDNATSHSVTRVMS